MLQYGASIYYTGGEINNCYYYDGYFKTDQELFPEENVGLTNTWTGQSVLRPYGDMSLAYFCTELNSDAFQQVVLHNYSFPCGDASLEGADYPFPAVITQTHKNNPSDPEGKKYVHYGEWPKERGLDLTIPDMELDLISYHTDADNSIVSDYFTETDVTYYDSGVHHNILPPDLEIRKDGAWVKFANVDNQTVMIDDKVRISARDQGGVCKLTVTGINKTEGIEIIPLRYLVNGRYYSVALNVNVTAVVNLSAIPITTSVKTGGEVRWNLILRDKNNNLIETNDISDSMGPGGNWTVTSNPSDVFSSMIEKAITSEHPFYLKATALKVGEADFKVQALKIKVRDAMNKDSENNIRTVDSNELDLHGICYSGNLILKHHNGPEAYVENQYVYINGASGINPNLVSDKDKSFTALNGEMVDKVSALDPTPVFAGWCVKDNTGDNHVILLDAEGMIVNDVDGITLEGKFNVNPAEDIELFAMWRTSYNLIFVQTGSKPERLPIDSTKYLVIARVPREGGNNQEYDDYCMTGASPGLNKQVTVKKVDLLHLQENDYYLKSPVIENTMLWGLDTIKNKTYFKLNTNNSNTYLKPAIKTNDKSAVVFCSYSSALDDTGYFSGMHSLYFTSNWRILFEGNEFVFHSTNQNIIKEVEGGIWLFKYDTSVKLHEFE
jgi:hypothetical protein